MLQRLAKHLRRELAAAVVLVLWACTLLRKQTMQHTLQDIPGNCAAY